LESEYATTKGTLCMLRPMYVGVEADLTPFTL